MKKLAFLVVLGLLLTSCGKAATGPETIKIGLIGPLSGGAAAYGQDAVNTAQMVIDAYNAKNTGKKFELIAEDGVCNGQQAVSAVQKLINVDGVKAIMGGVCSPETIAAGKIAQDQGVVMVSALSSAPEVSQIGDHIFRFYNDLDASEAVAAQLTKMNAKKIGFVYVNNEYGNAYGEAIKKLYPSEIIINEGIQSEEKDLSLVAKKVAKVSKDLDALIVVLVDENANVSFIKSLDAEGQLATLSGKIIGSEAFLTDNVLKQVGPLANGFMAVQFPALANLGGSSKEFVEQYKVNHAVGSSEVFITLFGEATKVLIDSIDNVGYDGDKIADAIHAITKESPRQGIFGSYYFDGADAQALDFVIRVAKDGKLE